MSLFQWPKNQFGENELDRILYLGIPESTPNYEALRRGAKKAIKKMILDMLPKTYEAPALRRHELSESEYYKQIGFNLAVIESREKTDAL